MRKLGVKSHCAPTSFLAKPLHPAPVTAHSVTGFLSLLGKAAFGAVDSPVPGGDEVTAAENTLLVLAGNTQHLLLQLRCQGQNAVSEPGTLERIAVPLGAAWVDAVIQGITFPVMEIAAMVANQGSHLPELEIVEPGQLTHDRTPA